MDTSWWKGYTTVVSVCEMTDLHWTDFKELQLASIIFSTKCTFPRVGNSNIDRRLSKPCVHLRHSGLASDFGRIIQIAICPSAFHLIEWNHTTHLTL